MATEKRIFCDTNYLLDLCDASRSRHEDAVALAWYAAVNSQTARLIAAVSSFKDAYYILSRLYRSESSAHESIEELMGGFIEPVDMLASYGAEALASDEQDFEDGLIRACAEHEGASVIISDDRKAFAGSPVPAMTAAAFLQEEDFDYDSVAI